MILSIQYHESIAHLIFDFFENQRLNCHMFQHYMIGYLKKKIR